MSHLSILPTVLRDADCLAASLISLGLRPSWGGQLRGFGPEQVPVVLQVSLADDTPLGWRRDDDGSLALVGDLQRISRSSQLQDLLGRITADYAARLALREASRMVPAAVIEFHA